MGYSPRGHSRTQLSSGSAGHHNLGALGPGGGVAWTTLTPSLPTGLGPESPLKLAFSSPLPL